jgi:hypothetical protein
MQKRLIMMIILYSLILGCSGQESRSSTQGQDSYGKGLLQGSLLTDIETLACPRPDQIQSKPIPSSYNAVYYAKSGRAQFSGIDLAGLTPGNMSFLRASVSQTGGVWRLYCDYQGFTSLQHLSLATEGDSQFYAQCRFDRGATVCSSDLTACLFICRKPPQIVVY